MRKVNTSTVAIVLAGAALFTALGGTSWAAGLITGSQIKNGAITSSKIAHGQVKNANLAAGAVHTANLASQAVTGPKIANNAITSSKVADGSLNATDLAPNTFLPAGGTAADSNKLGGKSPNAFVQGTGNMLVNRISIPAGNSNQFLLDVGLGEIDGTCLAGGKPELSFTAQVAPINLIEWATTYPNTVDINTTNGLTVGTSYIEPNTSGLPQAVTFQAAASNTAANHVATAWTTGQDIGGTSCIFTAQALTTG